jgi:hypothetical protein
LASHPASPNSPQSYPQSSNYPKVKSYTLGDILYFEE